MELLLPILIVVVVLLAMFSLRVVKEYDRGVIFFLGKCTGVRGPGLIILVPILEQMTKVTLRTITMNIPSPRIIPRSAAGIVNGSVLGADGQNEMVSVSVMKRNNALIVRRVRMKLLCIAYLAMVMPIRKTASSAMTTTIEAELLIR